MSERRSFFQRILGSYGEEEDQTRIYPSEEVGGRRFLRKDPEEGRLAQGFTVERAARVIDELPPDVPPESALQIVRGTLLAAGIRFEDLERSTRARESKLNSEVDLARDRQEELRRRTEEVVRSLEDQIRKAREARDLGIEEEEENVARAVRGLREVERVRSFFGFPASEEEESTTGRSPLEEESTTGRSPFVDQIGDETQVLEPFDADDPRVARGRGEPEDPPGPPYGTTGER